MDSVQLDEHRLEAAIQEVLNNLVAQKYCREAVAPPDGRHTYTWQNDVRTKEFRLAVRAYSKTPLDYARGLYAALM